MANIIGSIIRGATKAVGRSILSGARGVLSELEERTGAPNIAGAGSADVHTEIGKYSDARIPQKEVPINAMSIPKDIDLDRQSFKPLRIDQDDFLKSLNQLSDKQAKEINIVNRNVLKSHDFAYKQLQQQAVAVNLVATRVNTVQRQYRDLFGEFSKLIISNEELKRLINKKNASSQPIQQQSQQKDDEAGGGIDLNKIISSLFGGIGAMAGVGAGALGLGGLARGAGRFALRGLAGAAGGIAVYGALKYKYEQTKADLAKQLGRDPTDEEVELYGLQKNQHEQEERNKLGYIDNIKKNWLGMNVDKPKEKDERETRSFDDETKEIDLKKSRMAFESTIDDITIKTQRDFEVTSLGKILLDAPEIEFRSKNIIGLPMSGGETETKNTEYQGVLNTILQGLGLKSYTTPDGQVIPGLMGRLGGQRPQGPADVQGGPQVGPRGGSGAASQGRDVAMSPAGSGIISSNQLTTIKTPSGREFKVNKDSAANFQMFVNAYEGLGGKIGSASGGIGTRGNASYHPGGRAMDINQTGYGIRSRTGKTLPTDVEDWLADTFGLNSANKWNNPDTGHFEASNSKKAAAARAAQGITQDENGNWVFPKDWKPPALPENLAKKYPDLAKAIEQQAPTPQQEAAVAQKIQSLGLGGLKKASGESQAQPQSQSQPAAVGDGGKIEPRSLFREAVAKFQNSSLNGVVPSWGAKFGITTGAPQEWARWAVALGQQESNLRTAKVNPDGSLARFSSTLAGENSFGPFQFNKGEYGLNTWADVNNPGKNVDALIKVVQAGKVFDYFGSMQRPGEVLQHMGWAGQIAQSAGWDAQPQAGVKSDREQSLAGSYGKISPGIEGNKFDTTFGSFDKSQAIPFQMADAKQGEKSIGLTPSQQLLQSKSPEEADAAMARSKTDWSTNDKTPDTWQKLTPTPEQKAETDKVWADVDKQRKDDGSFDVVGKDVAKPIEHRQGFGSLNNQGRVRTSHHPEQMSAEPGSEGYGQRKDPSNIGLCTV